MAHLTLREPVSIRLNHGETFSRVIASLRHGDLSYDWKTNVIGFRAGYFACPHDLQRH